MPDLLNHSTFNLYLPAAKTMTMVKTVNSSKLGTIPGTEVNYQSLSKEVILQTYNPDSDYT